jgi:hypothetical protein
MRQEMENVVDQAIFSHFDRSYLWARLSDPELAYRILVAPTASLQKVSELFQQQAFLLQGTRYQKLK